MKRKGRENIFEVDFGKGIEFLSYDALRLRFQSLNAQERDYINAKLKCNSLITIDLPQIKTINP